MSCLSKNKQKATQNKLKQKKTEKIEESNKAKKTKITNENIIIFRFCFHIKEKKNKKRTQTVISLFLVFYCNNLLNESLFFYLFNRINRLLKVCVCIWNRMTKNGNM